MFEGLKPSRNFKIFEDPLLQPDPNTPKTNTEAMYEYLTYKERELILQMGQLDPNSYAFKQKYDQFKYNKDLKERLEKELLYKKSHKYYEKLLQEEQDIFAPYIANNLTEKNYNPVEGFVLRFDFLTDVPPFFDDIQVHFGIFNKGQQLEPYLKTDMYKAIQQTSFYSNCIFVERRVIQDISPFADTIIYFELFSNEKAPMKRELNKRAWTMHELFSNNQKLFCGKIKLPLYNSSINPLHLFQKQVQPIHNSYIFVRICTPNDFNTDSNTYTFVEADYQIPPLHLSQGNDKQQTLNYTPSRMPKYQIIRSNKGTPDYYPNMSSYKNNFQGINPMNQAQNYSKTLQGDWADDNYAENSSLIPRGFPFKNPSEPSFNYNNNNNPYNRFPQGNFNPNPYRNQYPQQYNKQFPQNNYPSPQSSRNPYGSPNLNVGYNPYQKNNGQNPYQQSNGYNPYQNNGKNPYQKNKGENPYENNDQGEFDENTQDNEEWGDTENNTTENLKQGKKKKQNEDFEGGIIIKLEKLQKMEGFEKKKLEVNIQIYDGIALLKDFSGNQCQEKFFLNLTSDNDSFDYEKNFQIDIQQLIKKSNKIKLENMILQMAFSVNSKPIGWIFNNIFKGNNINNGKFKTYLLSPPVSKPPFKSSKQNSPMIIQYVIQDFNFNKSLPIKVNLDEDEDSQYLDVTQQKPNQGSNKKNNRGEEQNTNTLQSADSDNTQQKKKKKKQDSPAQEPKKKDKSKIKRPQNMITLFVKNVEKYTDDTALSFDFVIMKPNEMLLDAFQNPSTYDYDEVVPRDQKNLVDLKAQIRIPVDYLDILQTKDFNQYFIVFKFVKISEADEEEQLGWYAQPLFKDKKVHEGNFSEFIFEEPLELDFPFVKNKQQKRKEKVNFSLQVKKYEPIEDEEDILNNIDNYSNSIQLNESEQSVNIENKFIIGVNQVTNLPKEEELQIKLGILNGNEFLKDDLGEECVYATEFKKSAKKSINFSDEFLIDIDVVKIKKNTAVNLDQVFAVLYLINNKKEQVLWYYLKLFKDKQLQVGNFNQKMCLPPFQQPLSINQKTLKTSSCQIQYFIKLDK